MNSKILGSNCGLGSNPGGDAIQYIGGTLLWFSFLLQEVFSLTSWVPSTPLPPPPLSATPHNPASRGFFPVVALSIYKVVRIADICVVTL